jgi:hypothetical protein
MFVYEAGGAVLAITSSRAAVFYTLASMALAERLSDIWAVKNAGWA